MADMTKPTPEQMQKMFEEMQRKENEGLSPEEIEEKNRKKEEQKQKNIALIGETLKACENGSYEKDGETVSIGLSKPEMTRVRVFLPDEIKTLTVSESTDTPKCVFSCENKDALSLAREKGRAYGDRHILVLNLASAKRPGGGVRDGFNGQEEDLCRKTTLLQSLESDDARCYYGPNNETDTNMGSDGVLISPDVAVLRDEKEEFLAQPFYISVISCSAPNVRFGFEGKSEEEYKKMLYDRIEGMLKCANSMGYKNLILGAFGCGVFKNDASVVSDAFYKALTGPCGCGFEHADFAVLCSSGKEYNYNEFSRNFG